MKILSRNVNGIRSVIKKGFTDTIARLDPDVICLQEPKAFLDQCPREVFAMGYHITWHAGTRPGYAGTVILSKQKPVQSVSVFDQSVFHDDGRITQIDLGGLIIINGYFPNGGQRADGTEMLSYKLAFYDKLQDYLKQYKNIPHVVLGDYNICHTEIDIARPKQNQNSIGFLPIEREKISQFLASGYRDVFRHFNPTATDAYTWRSYRAGARANNVGRRIDYACVPEQFMHHVSGFTHHHDIHGSDHCPISIEMKGR